MIEQIVNRYCHSQYGELDRALGNDRRESIMALAVTIRDNIVAEIYRYMGQHPAATVVNLVRHIEQL